MTNKKSPFTDQEKEAIYYYLVVDNVSIRHKLFDTFLHEAFSRIIASTIKRYGDMKIWPKYDIRFDEVMNDVLSHLLEHMLKYKIESKEECMEKVHSYLITIIRCRLKDTVWQTAFYRRTTVNILENVIKKHKA
jgi:hypothetical protein